jgi:hypothetical protein
MTDYVWLNANAENPDPMNYYDYPYDHSRTEHGHIDWTVGTDDKPITATLNSRKFQVWDLCAKDCTNKNAKNTGSPGYQPPNGRAKLGGADMRCYQIAKPFKQQLTDNSWYDCTANYYCTYASRKILRTTFDVNKATTEVVIQRVWKESRDSHEVPEEVKQWIKDAFQNLETVDEKSIPKAGSIYTIKNSKHEMQFYIDRSAQPNDVTYDPHRIQNITTHLVQRLVPKVIEDGKYDGCVAGFGGSAAVCSYKFRFPAQVDIKVQTSLQWADDWDTKDRVFITTKGIKSDKCTKAGELAGVYSSVFSGVSALLSGGASAIVGGLGGIFGIIGKLECGDLPLLS